ncbi:unnamed protein product [Rotaria sp. Silwood1]|nr:unnamed protein product [Rotaria sp. Silwood1]CAF4561628.1 unnamed protein product [Rotaria sp. Silwood1]CAF4715700.1 unnamed protein product [Rotaria sp. Silwood1]
MQATETIKARNIAIVVINSNTGLHLTSEKTMVRIKYLIPIKSIQTTQDRSLSTQQMADIGEKVVPYKVVNSLEEALQSAERFGYPVLARYDVVSLDDRRSSYANNREELISLVNSA